MNPPLPKISQPAFEPHDAPHAGADPFADLIAAPAPTAADAIVPFAPAGNFVSYYGLRENPFPDSVNPGFFFRTESHAEAFRSALLAVEFQASLGMVTGPSGAGKTLVSQLLLQHLDQAKYRAVLVLVTPGLSKTGLLREILSELDLALPVGISRVQDLVKSLSNYIIELHQQGQRLIIIVDESHLLSADCLHIVRTISNIETPQLKLTTCLLFGESRLSERLDHPSYESLRNRIYMRSRLQALTAAEVAQYARYRLMTAGRLEEVFTEGALAALHAHSAGICRSLNKLAMLSMIEGATRRSAMIDEEIVNAAAERM
jgi:general secretion pathway protein A